MAYDDMTKAELLAEIENRGLLSKVSEVAKFPAKPTNDELIKVLELADAELQTGSEPVVAVKKVTVEDICGSGMTKEELMLFEQEVGIPVIVTDYDTSVTTEENIENRVFRGSIGNLMTGTISFAVAMHGRMQYLPRIVIDHLRTVTMASNYKDATGKEVSARDKLRFNVTEVEGWTEDELEAHRKEQLLKKL